MSPRFSFGKQQTLCIGQRGAGCDSFQLTWMGSMEELYTVTVRDNQLPCSTVQVCFGLVCLSTNCRIYLCNPAMQQLCELPKYSPSITPGYDHFGFGYLQSRKEYKVVHFFYRGLSMDVKWCPLSDLLFAQIKYEVLTITKVGGGISFSKWKEIVDTPFSHPLMPGLLVNECMYWLTKRFQRPQPPRDIISFDLENEKFLTISYPSFFESIHGLNLMDLKGMLCLPDEGSFRRSSILDLWILKDKISCTWVKEYSIDLVNFGPGMIKSNFKTWNEETIFTHLDTVVIYDLKRKCFRVVKRVALARYEIFSTQKACFL
ncbi:putative cytochrome 71A1-like [Capsicum annuum]|nr:putative cytochrome 71A1-like [Capsicum annuum]KAF3671175.1 putative cytochrome 71A1-like [Capsicum annuum]